MKMDHVASIGDEWRRTAKCSLVRSPSSCLTWGPFHGVLTVTPSWPVSSSHVRGQGFESPHLHIQQVSAVDSSDVA